MCCAGLSHALSAPSASMLKASMQEGSPLMIQEDRPLLAADSCDSQGFAQGRAPGSLDHSAHSSCGSGSSTSVPATQVGAPSSLCDPHHAVAYGVLDIMPVPWPALQAGSCSLGGNVPRANMSFAKPYASKALCSARHFRRRMGRLKGNAAVRQGWARGEQQ